MNAFLTHGLLLLRVGLCRSKKHFPPPASQASRKGPGTLLLSPAGSWCFLLPSTRFLTSFFQQLPLRKLEHVMKSTFSPFFPSYSPLTRRLNCGGLRSRPARDYHSTVNSLKAMPMPLDRVCPGPRELPATVTVFTDDA